MIRFLVLSLGMLLMTSGALANSPAVTISLVADRASYGIGDRIELTMTLVNTSGHPLMINRRLAYPGPDLIVEIRNAQGTSLRWLPPQPPPPLEQADFVELHANQQVTLTIPDIGRHLFDKFTQGEDYRVRAKYHNQDSGSQWGYAAWTGTVESGAITFRWGGER